MPVFEIWPEDIQQEAGRLVVGAILEKPNGDRIPIQYRLPARYRPALAQNSDPFVLAALFSAMRSGSDLRVHGTVSPSLLDNLAEFQAFWRAILPARYRPVEIRADEEAEPPAPISQGAIAGFSGGLDSCFTVYRHKMGLAGRANQDIRAAIFIHGFDIPLHRPAVYQRARRKSQALLDSLGVEMIPMEISLKALGDHWEDSHGAALASCLMLLSGGYSTGLIASSAPWIDIMLPWGTNPYSDPYLSSQAFRIIHDGTSFTSYEKIQTIHAWPEALQNLRVCVRGVEKDRNCGRCTKCVRYILYFRIGGFELPPAFEKDVGNLQLATMKYRSESPVRQFQVLYETAKAAGVSGDWLRALQFSILQNRIGLALKKLSGRERDSH